MGARFYLTTAIDYVNSRPHLGTAYEKITADAIARYKRLAGFETLFVMGNDEHSQNVFRKAKEEGLDPLAYCDQMEREFRAAWDLLDVSYDDFIRTTQPRHEAAVQELVRRIASRGDVYEGFYEGWYCVGCEAFKQDAEIVDGKCILHPTRTLEWVEERNWFFRLSRYTDFLRARLIEHPESLQPESRRNEMLALLDRGLDDVSASRSRLAWGIPFPKPLSSGEVQTTYVWFEALPNYLTATGFPDGAWTTRWPAQLHIVGKDITRFHSIIWPAMLESAGLPLPERVWGHGFVLLGGERFSKSAGVRLDLNEAIGRYGADAFRYFLLREVPFDADGSFTWERFDDRYNSDLANAWGNLASRVISMVERYCGGVVPAGAITEVDGLDVAELSEYHAAMDGTRGFLLHEALKIVWQSVVRGNEYVDRQAPWKLAKDPALKSELEATLASLIRQLARQAVLVAPFMPAKAQALWTQLGAPGTVADQRFDALPSLVATGWRVRKGESLFPKDKPAA
jgi:methionyl-tRNA synthetase